LFNRLLYRTPSAFKELAACQDVESFSDAQLRQLVSAVAYLLRAVTVTAGPKRKATVISIRRVSLGGGFRYLMDSVAAGDGAREGSSSLTAYYAESGTPPGVFLGGGLADLDGGRGVQVGSQVSEEHLRLMLAACADPISGEPLGSTPRAPAGRAPVAVLTSLFHPASRFQSPGRSPTRRPERSSTSATGKRSSTWFPTPSARCSTPVRARTGSSRRT
jgi:hypothetical protein